MAQKIIKIGSSLGVTLPKRLLKKLNLKQSDEVELEYNNRHQSIEITAVKPQTEPVNSLFAEVKTIIDEHQAEFAKLDE